MTSFVWKHKTGERISAAKCSSFEFNAATADENINIDGEMDWQNVRPAPKRRAAQLEDPVVKSRRLRQEGETLAEAERYWEAIRKWDDALQLTPADEKLYEMKSQAYTCLNELFPAIQAAAKAVELNPRWSVSHQTLGRAHLNMGEVRLAVKCFSRAIHISPDWDALRDEDLGWSVSLLRQKRMAEERLLRETGESEKFVELSNDIVIDETKLSIAPRVVTVTKQAIKDASSSSSLSSSFHDDDSAQKHIKKKLRVGLLEMDKLIQDGVPEDDSKKTKILKSMPPSYVHMRD